MSDYVEDFVDDGVQGNSDLYDCDFTSIDAVINEVTVFTGCDPDRQTENGVRTLIAYGEGYNRSAFFTDSKKLKDVFASPNRHYVRIPCVPSGPSDYPGRSGAIRELQT